MRNYCIIFLLVIAVCYDLPAQKTINGITRGELNTGYPRVSGGFCDTVFSFPAIDPWPGGLASDGTFLYSIGSIDTVIYKYDLNGNFVDRIPLPGELGRGGDLDYDGTHLWVVSEQDRKVYKIDKTNGHIITSFLLPTSSLGDPNNFGCAYDNGYIWTTEYKDETLMRINATTGTLVDSFAIHREVLPLKIINGELYGIQFVDETSYGETQMLRFNKATGTVLDSIPWCLNYPLGFCRADDHLWGVSSGIGIGTQRIYKFNSMLPVSKSPELEKDFSFYPNPANNILTIETRCKADLEILNIEGEIVKRVSVNGGIINIDVSDLSGGLFFVKAYTEKGVSIKKLVKL